MGATSPSVMLAKYRLAPSRRLGQNFLADENVARKVVAAVNARSDDVVVEVGSGFGAITFGLAETARHVFAVEVDGGIVRAFREEYAEREDVTLVNRDILQFDLAGAAESCGATRILVVGNLPYSVTSPTLDLLFENRAVVSRAVVMVQAEVGARIAAGPGSADYSALSVVAQFHSSVRQLFAVKRTCFYPRPKVDSRVVELRFEDAPARTSGHEIFTRVVHDAFGKRRKMLRQSLRPTVEAVGIDPEALEAETRIDLTRRGETLSIEEFDALATALGALRSGRRSQTR